MAWCRWGQPCWATVPRWKQDVGCNPCKGSDVYVYDDVSGGITCCSCILKDGAFFNVATEEEMVAHLRKHAAAGHHVRPSLLVPQDELEQDGTIDDAIRTTLTAVRERHDRLRKALFGKGS